MSEYQSSYELQVEATSKSTFHEGIVDGIADMIKVFEDQGCNQIGNMKIEFTPYDSFGMQFGREVGLVAGRTAKVSGVLSCTGASKLIRAKVIVPQYIGDSTRANIRAYALKRYVLVGFSSGIFHCT